MKSVNGTALLEVIDGELHLTLQDKRRVMNRIFDNIMPKTAVMVELDVLFTKRTGDKSQPQMGYYRAEILPKIAAGFRDLGNQDVDEDVANEILKRKYFYRKVWNSLLGEFIHIPESLASASKERMSQLIDNAIIFGASELHVTIESPEEYKKRIEDERKKFTK